VVPPPVAIAPPVEYHAPEPAPAPPPPAPPPPAPVAPPVPAPTLQSVVQTPVFVKKLDELAQELDAPTKKTIVNVGTVAGMSSTLLSVGYVIWCLRGGSLVATLLTTLPLWRWLDPLPVLDHYDENGKRRQGQADEDEERLRSMMD
jgi:hypothetical protein